MDTSPEYINMCKKATELQEMWKPETGDFYKLPGHFITCIVLKNSLIDMDAIWLPRVDQLIELSAMHWSDIIDYCGLEYSDYKLSFEIALLKIVMYKVFNKVWNNEDWRKTE